MRLTKNFIVIFTMLAIILSTPTIVFADSYIDWEKGIVRGTGLVLGPKNVNMKSNFYKTHARQAARLDALRNIAETIFGVDVIKDFEKDENGLERESITTKLNHESLIPVAKLAKQIGEAKFYEEDGACELSMEVTLYGKASISEELFSNSKHAKLESFPKPINNALKINDKYTGLIIDCTNLKLNPTLSPILKNDKDQLIYGYKNLPYDILINGLVAYSKGVNNVNRAGQKPLIIKAVALDKNNRSNPIVSIADSDKILVANQNSHFLNKGAVVFIY